MSPKNQRLTAGLTALGLLGCGVSRGWAQDPPAPMPPAAVASQALSPPTVVLLDNNQVLVGEISEENDHVLIKQRGGVIKRSRRQVVGTFRSLREAYDYRVQEVPDDDPDEHLKLARWCLAQKMPEEAMIEVKKVMTVSPKSKEANAMLLSLQAAEERRAGPKVDTGLMQTKGEVPDPNDQLNPALIQRAQRELGISGVPVIFDLPPTLAVKHADEFRKFVHPVLQNACAKCHNEDSDLEFRLIRVGNPAKSRGNALSANLDATLQLIDPTNPSRSELLSIVLVPHGGPEKRPIFTGSNDARFKVIAGWVNKLQSKPNAGERAAMPGRTAGRPGGSPPTADNNSAGAPSGFASERTTGGLPLPFTPTPSGTDPLDPSLNPPRVMPPVQYVKGQGMVPDDRPTGGDDFPIPFSAGGGKPAAKPPVKPPGGAAAAPLPALPGDPAKAAKRPDAAAAGKSASAKPASKTSAKSKDVKIDPTLLENALKAKYNGGATPPGQ